MNQQPDKLFREKLEGYQKPAPTSAWNKIDANLNKNKSTGLWWKIAASLLLLAVATYIVWPKNQGIEKISAKKVEEVKPLTTIKADKLSKELPTSNETPVSLPKSVQEYNVAKVNKEHQQPKQQTQEPTITLEESMVPVDNKVDENIKAIENIITPEVVVASTETGTIKSDQYITIVVTADEANKYLTENSTTQATSVARKPSTLRKLLKQASKLANDQSPLADLRQKKDEILALNFDSKKQRGQNK